MVDVADVLSNPENYGIPTCMSHHPDPDPKKDPMAWRPLCGRGAPFSITPDRDQVTCRACLAIMGRTIHEEDDLE